jgi:hypothetical protein
MRGNKCKLFHVYMYRVLPVKLGSAAYRTVCSSGAAVFLVLLALDIEVGVFTDPPRNNASYASYLFSHLRAIT